jgi:hypothetical protein
MPVSDYQCNYLYLAILFTVNSLKDELFIYDDWLELL